MSSDSAAAIATRFLTTYITEDSSCAELLVAQMPWLSLVAAKLRLAHVGALWAILAERAPTELVEPVTSCAAGTGDAALLSTLMALPTLADETFKSLPPNPEAPAASGTPAVARLEVLAAAAIIVGVIGPRLAAANAVSLVNRNIRGN